MQRCVPRTVKLYLSQKRFYKKLAVRVRFAPSPTGQLHLGGLRTALYNYLFARSKNGTFILRIEDTDQTRIVPGAMEKIQDDLLWAGIIPDEDPVRDGPVGPYIQSKRLDIYKEQVVKLLENGSAYYCFCSEQRLDMLRKEAVKRREVPRYDNRCRYLASDEVKKKLRDNVSYCVRLKLLSDPVEFDDLVYGCISHDIARHEGDPVILKSDGCPTYHLASVVDDHLMEISHVLRGVEWQISTPKHIMLYKAFGWEPPFFAHLPLILNANGTKLSKRQNDIMVEAYRKEGIFPLALLNYITYTGGGFAREPNSSQIYSYGDLIKQFDITKINQNSCKLMSSKLLELNQLELSNLLKDEKNHRLFVERIRRLVAEAFPEREKDGSLQLDERHVISTLKWAESRICKLSDIITPDLAFLWVMPASPSGMVQPGYADAVKALSEQLDGIDVVNFKKDSIIVYLKEFTNNTNGIEFNKLMRSLRAILSGLTDGPGVADMMEILGKERTLMRLRRSIS